MPHRVPARPQPPIAVFWQAVRHWVAQNTFVPSWLPERWSHPAAGYVLAAVLELVATTITLLFVGISPTFSFPGILTILAVALVALSWGAAPSLLATVVGTALLEAVVLPRTLHGGVEHAGDVMEIAVCLAVGSIISVVASGTEQARRQAVLDRSAGQARELALRETNARTDEFLSIASHELRSPLTSLKMALQLARQRLRRLTVQEGTPGGELSRRVEAIGGLLQTAEQQVDRQNRLVGDFLDVSRIRANKLEFHREPCDLAVIVHEAVEEQRLTWPDRTITFDLPERAVPIDADAHRIGQVITNYLTNALKYSSVEAPVAVSLQLAGNDARVTVHDNGPGLSAEQQAHIWERFHRVPGITQQSGSGAGLGLGLYICRTIIEYHRGHLGVTSTPGKGSAFWFTLPRASHEIENSDTDE